MPAILVLTTLPNDDSTTAELARTLIVERLAACVNVHGPMASMYRWKGRVERDAERQVVIKTTRDRLEALRKRIHELHPYELPEFVVIDIDGGSDTYLDWVKAETA
ncbi:MAG: divalent-cation tolerance protein CutA [Acidobacteria bacterium]|nr:MAG: divalent-cation tolerance protein CutA [Acidobacteriota bacterium]